MCVTVKYKFLTIKLRQKMAVFYGLFYISFSVSITVTELHAAYIQIIYHDGPHGVRLDCPYEQRDH